MLSYGGYATRIDGVRASRPFETEYSARFCGSRGPNLYHQVPRYVWQEPLRALSTSKRVDLYQPTYLRAPFAARMAVYEPAKCGTTFPAINNGEAKITAERQREDINRGPGSGSTVDRSCSTRMVETGPIGNGKPFCPRPGSLMSKHPKTAQYARDTCFFQPTHTRKRHYYVINPRWFSEKDAVIRKNNVFA